MEVQGINIQINTKRFPSTLEKGVIVPGVLISFLALLYIFIDKGSGQRLGFLTTILLTQVMFLTMMTNFVPTARENPAFQLMFF